MPKTVLLTALLVILGVSAPGHGQSDPEGTDYPALANSISDLLHAHHYNPSELDDPAYLAVESRVDQLARTATSDDEFLSGFAAIWDDGPFSHVRLSRANSSAADLAEYLDNLRVGDSAVALDWEGDIAVLSVNTMMGLDTIERIGAAYTEIDQRETRALIIDLRRNEGGAFAIRPLISHLLSENYDAGTFVSQGWNGRMDRAPTLADTIDTVPWSGWSIRRFWADVQTHDLTRIQFQPEGPVYGGPVYVLISSRTASAAELAAEALSSSGRATMIGEQTIGHMLSQSIYDLPGGFHLSLPIADYYSAEGHRIEGAGVAPDVAVEASQALDVALQLVRVASQ